MICVYKEVICKLESQGLASGTGVSNPFYNARCYRFTLDDDVYSLRSSSTSKGDRMTGYVKVAYTFDFLKKVKHDAKQDVDTKINSAILKVE